MKFFKFIPSVFLEDLTINLARVTLVSLTSTDSLGVTVDSETVTDPADTTLTLPADSLANPALLPSLSSPLIRTIGEYIEGYVHVS
jgi:hypothetical protein